MITQTWREFYLDLFSPVLQQDEIIPACQKGMVHRKHASVKQMALSCIDYLTQCRENRTCITLTGMAIACGFYSRVSFMNTYKIDSQYRLCLQIAKTAVEHWVEDQLYNKTSYAGARFVLQAGFKTWIPEEKRTIENHNFEVTIGTGKDES
jgi:hypothetical protein